MDLLPILKALQTRRAAGRDCGDVAPDLWGAFDRFRSSVAAKLRESTVTPDEILNRAVLAVIDSVANFRGGSEGEAVRYCRITVDTKVVDALRHEHSRKRTQLELVGDDLERIDRGDERANPESLFLEHEEQAEARRLVAELLERLPPADAGLIEQVDIVGRSIREVADAWGEKENSVTKRRRRLLLRLGRMLRERRPDGG